VNGNPDGRQRTHSNQPRVTALLLDRQIGVEFITECNSILAFSLLHLTQVHGLVLSHIFQASAWPFKIIDREDLILDQQTTPSPNSLSLLPVQLADTESLSEEQYYEWVK
jgi:hypothetical protein